ncbi:MAG: hypothetical protein HGA37_13595, partial [Lentimicrobium sp.]|nr:hypothetical protein [Lentimicrobium sp.]
MKDLLKLLFALCITLNPLAQLVAQINAGADVNVCMGETVTLNAVATGGFGTDSYSFEVYNYQPESYTGGIPVTFPGNQDDQIAGPFPIGFQFCFFNNYYSEFYIGTNGWVGFTNNASWTTYTSQAIPSTNAAVPKNCIMAPWQDWYPGSSTSPVVFYKITGTAPNRKLVVYWDQCPMFSCTTEYGTFQIVLNEQSSIVENHLTNKPNCTWAGGTATQGVHNSDGTVAFTATGRNSTAWTASNESTRFVPSGIKWYTNYPNGAIVGYGPDLTIAPTITTTYTAVVNMCGGQVFTDDVTVFVLPADDASFSYGTSTFCRSGFSGPPSASFPGGTYSAMPAGLNIDPATGDIDLASSTAGTYTVTHTTNGSCPDSESIVLTVVNSPSATFSYPSPVYCMAAANPLPVFPSGSSAGTFTSSPAGLVFTDALTGEINLSASAPGTYTITNTIPPWGACPQVSYSTSISLTFVSADFNYPLNAYCTTSENPVPVFSAGATAGNFSASPSGLVFVSALTGEINLAASAQGHYVVTNTIAASSSCPEVSHATNIEIVSISAVFGYPLSSYCSNLPNPLPQFPPGSSSGTYTATPSGLVFVNPGTGQINLSASAPGIYTVTNTIPPWAACPEVSYSTTVEILPAPPIAAIPQGPEILCQNPPDTEYVTSPLANTTSYNWTLTPQAAGVISGTGITAIVNWNNQFTGLANIVVRGNNSCGNGLASPPLIVDINAGPGLPARPTGPVLHCQGPGITDYSTSGSSGAATYEWQLIPSSAGALSINGPHASITWSASFSGLAQLSVRGINACGTSSW